MTEIGKLVSRNVKRFRAERSFTLGELSRRSGLSKQTLSKVEQGIANPTLETVEAIAQAMGLSVRRMLTEWGSPVLLVPASKGAWDQHGHVQSKLLDEIYGSGFVRNSVMRLGRGTGDERPAHGAGALHHCYVIAGSIRLGPSDQAVDANEGDFVRFPGDVPHIFEALSTSAMLHVVTTLPGVSQFGDASRA